MSAHYIVRLISEDESIIQEIQDTTGFIDNVLIPLGIKLKGVSRHIDPYGTTTLNALQASEITSDLCSLQSENLTPAQMHFSLSLANMLQITDEQPHMYIKFIGD